MRKAIWMAASLIWLGSAASSAHAGSDLTFAVDAGSKVQFVSKATLETFTGVGDKLSGELHVDPHALRKAKAKLKLEVGALKTGLALRDEHLHGENWLDAQHFPQIVVSVDEVQGADALALNETREATIKGTITMHGITRPLAGKAKVRWSKAADGHDTLHVLSDFSVHLEDHKISIPSIVALKVARDIEVHVDLYASTPRA
jgi:polyisoprenoid-binding protein YceI